MSVPSSGRPRVLVTGGAGFIGANLVRRLGRSGWRTVVLDDLSTGRRENLADTDAEVVVGAVGDPAALRRALVGVDAVVHLAAEVSVSRSMTDPLSCHDTNVTATLRLLDACAPDTHVVLVSSAAVYGDVAQVPVSEHGPTVPVSPYGASKLAMEHYGQVYAATFGLPVVILRLFNVFGPYQRPDTSAAVVPNLLGPALRGEPLRITGSGEQSRDLVPVSHVTRVIHRILTGRMVVPTPVNVGLGTAISVRELARLVQEVSGRRASIEYLPERPGEIRHSCADTTLLRSLVPDLPQPSLREELAATAQWLSTWADPLVPSGA